MKTERLAGVCSAFGIVLLLLQNANAQPAIPSAALKIVDQQIPLFCQGISTTSTTQGYELTGSARAGLTSTFSRLADAGFQGAAKYRSEKSEGLAAKDLASAIANANNCRLAVLKFFSPYLLPRSNHVQLSLEEQAARSPLFPKMETPSAPSADLTQANAKIDALRSQLDAANSKIGLLEEEKLGQRRQAKSPILGVDDGDKFRLVKSLHDNMITARGGRLICHTMVHAKPGGERSDNAWAELAEIIGAAGWWLEGGRVQQNFYSDGFSIAVSSDSGDGFICGYQLQQMLLTLNVPVRFVDKRTIPDLITCEKENPLQGCVAISIGDFK